jgi:murein L,D-transpeptidase YcbB/YkuD
MFPNPYAVYLHDTPSGTLFAQERTFSHGCIRVEKPVSGGASRSTTRHGASSA